MGDNYGTRAYHRVANLAELSIIVPVLNERENIRPLIERISQMDLPPWEIIFVDDDSADNTAALVREIAQSDPRIRIIRRIGRSGLASACIEGFLSALSPFLAVMDGDLQHDESILPRMLSLAKSDGLELVVASRNAQGGGMGEFAESRVRLSNLGRSLSRLITHVELTDPMSGFFLLRREFFEEVVYRLSQYGFKILLDLVASARRPVRFAEVPYTFRTRRFGDSKLDVIVGVEFLMLIMDKLAGDLVPGRFAIYSLVGLSGVIVHLCILGLLYREAQLPLLTSQSAATLVAMVWNFLLNNAITYRDRKLKGWSAISRGLAVFVVGCSIGALANLGLTRLLYDRGVSWYVAGISGLIVSSVWNFAISEAFTWKILQRRRSYAERVHRPALLS